MCVQACIHFILSMYSFVYTFRYICVVGMGGNRCYVVVCVCVCVCGCGCVGVCVWCVGGCGCGYDSALGLLYTFSNAQEDVLSEVAKSEGDVIAYLDQINRYCSSDNCPGMT